MSYRLNTISFGTGKKSSIFDIDIPYDVYDFCYIKDFGYLFVLRDNHCVSRMEYNGKLTLDWIGSVNKVGLKDGIGNRALLDHPSSICFLPSKRQCFLIEKGGASVRCVNTDDGCIYQLLGSAVKTELATRMDKFNISKFRTASCVDRYGKIYWSVDEINQCYQYNNGEAGCFLVNGVYAYSVASKINRSYISKPSGIACVKDVIYIADTGNYCIREITKNVIRLVTGNPTENILNPLMLKYAKGLLYFIDGHSVKYTSVSGDNIGTIYESHNIVSIDIDENKSLMVLEKTNA